MDRCWTSDTEILCKALQDHQSHFGFDIVGMHMEYATGVKIQVCRDGHSLLSRNING